MKTKVVMTALKAADPQSHRPQAMTGQVRNLPCGAVGLESGAGVLASWEGDAGVMR